MKAEKSGKMYCYAWYEYADPSIIKFGERWVFDGKDPIKDCGVRIRGSLGVRKGIYDRGEVCTAAIWNVSDLSKKINRDFKQSRMDDFIREAIPFLKLTRMSTKGEEHKVKVFNAGEIPADKLIAEVNKYLASFGQPLPIVGLAPWQIEAAEDVISAIKDKNEKVILAELCARFGKTIWAGALSKELDYRLIIVGSYVLTSFSSFIKDLTNFEQFKDFNLIEANSDDYEARVNDSLKSGKKTIVFVSMCNGEKRDDKIEFLFNLQETRLVFIDEADFGMKHIKQSKVLIDNKKRDDVIILMTGTNADSAGQYWPGAYYLSCTYPELVMAKKMYKSKNL